MSHADLGFLAPLFELASSLTDDDDVEQMALGLGHIHPDSELARDDQPLDGQWVSAVVTSGLTASIDHAVTLRDLVLRERAAITVNAPWTLLRGALEPAATALWVLTGTTHRSRRAHALRVWHHDYTERQKWEDDTATPVPPGGKSGRDRAEDVRTLAKQLGIKPTTVATSLSHADTVAAAGAAAGWSRHDARARWREASGFAHGRFWPMLKLTTPRGAEPIPGGFGVAFVGDHTRLAELARLTHDVLDTGLRRYAERAAAPATEAP